MSNMTKCKDCDTEISKNAEACPKCGAKIKKTSVAAKGCLGIILLFFGLGVIGAMAGGGESTSSAGHSPASPSAPAAAPAAPAIEDVLFHDGKGTTEATCRDLANAYSTRGKSTELQLSERFKAMKGKLFEFKMRVHAVEETFGSIGLQVVCKGPKRVLESADFLLGTEDSQRSAMVQLGVGDAVTVCGRFESFTRFTGIHGELINLGPCPGR